MRTGTPASAMRAFACRIVNSPKWKIDAASTALARPCRTPSTRWSRLPTPPEAMTGMATASATARVELKVEALFRSVAIHRGQKNLAGAESGDLARVADRLDAGRPPSAMGEDLPAGWRARRGYPLDVDGDDDALGAELLRRPAHDLAVGDRRRIDRGFVGAGEQEIADVVDGANAAADRERHEADFGRAP